MTAGGLSLWWSVPFAGLLLSLAVAPIVSAHFWHRHCGKITAACDQIAGEPRSMMYFWITGVLSAFLDNAPTYRCAHVRERTVERATILSCAQLQRHCRARPHC